MQHYEAAFKIDSFITKQQKSEHSVIPSDIHFSLVENSCLILLLGLIACIIMLTA
jgi:hypothetical protein